MHRRRRGAGDVVTGPPLLGVETRRVAHGGTVLALDDVSFSVPEGGAVALLGANGAGKTTALRAVTGLLRFHGGQGPGGSVLRGAENLRVGAFPARARRAERELRQKVADLFPVLAERADQPAGLLSG